MVKGIVALLLLGGGLAEAQTTITGTFKNPDGSGVTGRALVSLQKSTVVNGCSARQVMTIQQISTKITNGTLGSLSLWPSTCLSVAPVSTKTPILSVGDAAGTGAAVSAVCGTFCGVSGTITLTTGTNPAAGSEYSFTTGRSLLSQNTLAVLMLFTPKGNQPYCVLQPRSSNSINAPVVWQWGIGTQTTSLTLAASTVPLAASTAYTWSYSCVQPYIVTVVRSDGTTLYTGKWSVPNTGSADVTVLDAQ